MENVRQNVAPGPSSLAATLQPLWVGLLAFISLLALTILSVEMILRRNIDPDVAEIQALQQKHIETYLADAQFLERSDLAEALKTVPATEMGDAAATLNPLLYWVPHSDDGYGRATPLVAPTTREFLLRYQNDWIKGRSFLERGRLNADLALFEGLDAFQFWNLEIAPPLAQIAAHATFVLPSQMPVPEALDLLSAVKIRLIKGAVDRKPLEALKAVRQFAWLLMTTENYQLLTAGLATLEFERRAYRDFVDRGWIKQDEWKAIDRNTTARASRAFAATMGYLRVATAPEILRKVALGEMPPPGFCAAVNEQMPSELALRDQLTGMWPWEREFRTSYLVIDQIIRRAKETCRIKIFRALAEKGVFEEADPDAPWPLATVPYFRTVFALRDWTAMPRRFDAYDRGSRD